MKIQCYTCECGEDIYECDQNCVNCGRDADQSRFKAEATAVFTNEVDVEVVQLSYLGREDEE